MQGTCWKDKKLSLVALTVGYCMPYITPHLPLGLEPKQMPNTPQNREYAEKDDLHLWKPPSPMSSPPRWHPGYIIILQYEYVSFSMEDGSSIAWKKLRTWNVSHNDLPTPGQRHASNLLDTWKWWVPTPACIRASIICHEHRMGETIHWDRNNRRKPHSHLTTYKQLEARQLYFYLWVENSVESCVFSLAFFSCWY